MKSICLGHSVKAFWAMLWYIFEQMLKRSKWLDSKINITTWNNNIISEPKKPHKTSSALNQPENILSSPKRRLEAFWCVEGDPKIAWWLGKGIYRALQGTLFMTHAQVPPVLGLNHEQGSVLQSIYQVLSLLLLAAVIAFKWLSCPCWITGMDGGGGSFALKSPSEQAEQGGRTFTMTLRYYGSAQGGIR